MKYCDVSRAMEQRKMDERKSVLNEDSNAYLEDVGTLLEIMNDYATQNIDHEGETIIKMGALSRAAQDMLNEAKNLMD